MASSNCFLPNTVTSSPFSKDSRIPVQPALYRRMTAFLSFLVNSCAVSSLSTGSIGTAVNVGYAAGEEVGFSVGVELGVAVGIGSPVLQSMSIIGRARKSASVRVHSNSSSAENPDNSPYFKYTHLVLMGCGVPTPKSLLYSTRPRASAASPLGTL